MLINSPAFADQQVIPVQYTCQGKDMSPPLTWKDIPENTKSLALIVDDPDAPDPKAPKMVWVHWVLYNLPANSSGLAEDIGTDNLPNGTLNGINDWKKIGYGGPCPPVGEHRYFFKLYALDVVLPDMDAPTKADLEQAMADHVIAKTELVGVYQQ